MGAPSPCDRLFFSTSSFSQTRYCSVKFRRWPKVGKTPSVLHTRRREVDKRSGALSNSPVRVAGRRRREPTPSSDFRPMLTPSCWPVPFLQNGFGGESLGRSPVVCLSAGLHHSRRLRGGQVSQRVSASSLGPETCILNNNKRFASTGTRITW